MDMVTYQTKGYDTQMEITPDNYAAAVAAQLRAERAAKQMTVSQLAAKSGVTEQSLLRYLNEKRPIPVPALYQICDGLEIPVHELVRRAEARLLGEE